MLAAYLSSKDTTEAYNDQDVEDRRPHNGTDPHVSFGNEHTWYEQTQIYSAQVLLL